MNEGTSLTGGNTAAGAPVGNTGVREGPEAVTFQAGRRQALGGRHRVVDQEAGQHAQLWLLAGLPVEVGVHTPVTSS